MILLWKIRLHALTINAEVLLGTARVIILDKNERSREIRVLLDGCSQCNFITEELAEQLQLTKKFMKLPCAGVGEVKTQSDYCVVATNKSRKTAFESEVEFAALSIITGYLPSRSISKKLMALPQNLELADPEFNKPAKIDPLLGTALFYKLLCSGQFKLPEQPDVILQKTLLGWIVVGDVNINKHTNTRPTCHLITSLENQIAKFWEIEEVPTVKYLSDSERKCEELYLDTTRRDTDGKYLVRLPFKDTKEQLGESYSTALRRFHALERRLEKDAKLKLEYSRFLQEYSTLGHMTDITHIDDKHVGYYIPHHAVIKENNLTTKVRVVFDASAKSSTNLSLNDTLFVGPNIQDDLVSILLRFRLHAFVVTADLEKMNRQVKVDEKDTMYQKILWRENNTDTLRTFKLNTVTQGTASAPFLAIRTLHQLSLENINQFPLAASVVRNDFYVDDLLTGANSIAEVIVLKRQLIQLLKSGGFTLHKWCSNVPSLMPIDNKEGGLRDISFDSRKLLGILWNSSQDTINYTINSVDTINRARKRNILSQIAQLFDPLGLLGPIITSAKLILQEVWKARLEWDESIPQVISTKWIQFKTELDLLKNFKIRRRVLVKDAVDIQLHGFCDASEHAYGACIYLRSANKNNEICMELLCAKSRVAPLKTISIPRLELCAPVLLSKLIVSVKDALKLTVNKINLWSDSTITLHWIKTPPHTLKTFVANRVAEIQSLTSKCQWLHITTNQNPADYISRGQSAQEFITNQHWIHGPEWLRDSEENWKINSLEDIIVPEMRSVTVLIALKNKTVEDNLKNQIFEKFSSINSLNRFIALCRRLVNNKRSNEKVVGSYSIKELADAHRQLIKLVQEQYFSREIKELTKNLNVNAKSKLISLNPFLDTEGVIRVGGRLRNATMKYDVKYPILLPHSHYVTKLIIPNVHEIHWHAGVQGTLNAVRSKYWPTDGKNTVRHIIRNCVRCFKVNPKLSTYVMGNVPQSRITESRPFSNVGVDYCGPFNLKEKKFRNKLKIKAYVAVFVCFATKAIHFELVTDLTAETCLEAIKRFIARRRKPVHIYSDNGTNFVGAKNEILKIRAALLSEDYNKKVSKYFQNQEITWHFSPPRAPHFGGLWEAAVKSFKQHLYRTVGDAMFTYEQFNTCIVEIESILNSRPLTSLSSDPNDMTALTPSHFLIGDQSMCLEESDVRQIPENRLSMWQRIHKIKQHFWQRWHKEYLNQLRTQSKWHTADGTQIKIGTLVIIKEDHQPPMHWSIGRITALHPGSDGIVRIVTLKTQSGEYKRCINKLAPLPIEEPQPQQRPENEK